MYVFGSPDSSVRIETRLAYLINYTYSMQQSPSWEANRFSTSQELPSILWNQNVHYRVDKSPPPVACPVPYQSRLLAEWSRVRITTGARISPYSKPSRPALGHTPHHLQLALGSFPRCKAGGRRGQKLTTHLHLVSRLRISGSIPPHSI